MDWWEKVTAQNCGRALVKPKNQPGWVVLAPWWLKRSTIYSVDVRAAKRSSKTGYSQPRHLPVREANIWAFHITMNLPCHNQPRVSNQSLGWKLIVQWCGYMLVVLVGFFLMCDLERFHQIRSHIQYYCTLQLKYCRECISKLIKFLSFFSSCHHNK